MSVGMRRVNADGRREAAQATAAIGRFLPGASLFLKIVFTYGWAMQASGETLDGWVVRVDRLAGRAAYLRKMTFRYGAGGIMGDELLVFVGSLNREAPYFQGARGVGLCVYSFDEATLARSRTSPRPARSTTRLSCRSAETGMRLRQFRGVRLARRQVSLSASTGRTVAHLSQQATVARQHHRPQFRHPRRLEAAGCQLRHGRGRSGPVGRGFRHPRRRRPDAALASVRHEGTGPNAARQERSHAHSVTETFGGRHRDRRRPWHRLASRPTGSRQSAGSSPWLNLRSRRARGRAMWRCIRRPLPLRDERARTPRSPPSRLMQRPARSR